MNSFKMWVVAAVVLMSSLGQAATVAGGGQITTDNNGDMLLGQFSFSVAVAGTVTIDVDATDFDSYIYLYGDFLDSPIANDDESFNNTDSYLQLELDAGDYSVAIGPYIYSPTEGLNGKKLNRDFLADYAAGGLSDNAGVWAISVDMPTATAVPVPAALPLFLSALAGLGFLRRK